jgi:hypothetical protein
MAESISFEQLAEFIRDSACIGSRKAIARETQFERDLGITGDDGCELLEATEKRFDVKLHSEEDGYRATFNLGPNEFLFHSEGGFMLPLYDSNPLITIFGSETVSLGDENVRAFSVGELYEAICTQLQKSPSP